MSLSLLHNHVKHHMKLSYIIVALSMTYVLLPFLLFHIGFIERLSTIQLQQNITDTYNKYLIISFMLLMTFTYYAHKKTHRKIKTSIQLVALKKYSLLPIILALSNLALIYYLLIISKQTIGLNLGRDELFQLLEQSTGIGFMISLKVFLFCLVIVILQWKNQRKSVKLSLYIGILTIFSLTYITQSRSMALTLILTVVPFITLTKIRFVMLFIVMFLIFFYRFYIMDHILIYSKDWWIDFGLGEFIGIYLGSYLLVEINHSISLIDSFAFSLHNLPIISQILELLSIPETTIYINNLSASYYSLYGIAGNIINDFLLSPVISLISIILITYAVFLIRTATLPYFFIFSLYVSTCSSIATLFRWSLSGFIQSTLRDLLIFIAIMLILNIKKSRLNMHFG